MRRRALLAAALIGACASTGPDRRPASAPPAAAAPVAPVSAPTAAAAPAAPAPVAAAAPAHVEPLGVEEGAELFATACTSCHSGGFVQGSRISEKGWAAEVAKMRKWGALVDEEQAAPLAAWLARRYPAAEAAPADPTLPAAAALATAAPRPDRGPRGNAARGKEVFARDCALCHGAGALGTGGGPALVENRVLHQRDQFALLVQEGKGRMPAFADLPPGDVASLLAWLRGLGP